MNREEIKYFFKHFDYKIISPILILLFEILFLDSEFMKSSTKLSFYKCKRNSNEFNYSLIKNGNILEVHNKFELIDSYKLEDIQTDNKSSVIYLINQIMKDNEKCNIKCQNKLLMFYKRKILADEVYLLKNEPQCFSELLKLEFILNSDSIKDRDLKVLIYLLLQGYLEDITVYVYRNVVVFLHQDESIEYFVVDFSNYFGIIHKDRNYHLGHISGSYSYLHLYTDLEYFQKLYSTEKFKSTFSDFLNCNDKNIVNLVREKKYLEISILVPDSELENMLEIIKTEKIIEDIKTNVTNIN